MPLPTFVIAGAQKCGTTSLHRMLRDHPQLFMSRPKELHFFDRNWDRGIDWYVAQFKPGPEHVHFGESSPVYMYDEVTRQRMIDVLPDARIVVILRDPIKRAYSQFWHSKRRGVEQTATFEEAVALEPLRQETEERRRRSKFTYVDRGRYVEQLLALEEVYGRERLHVMFLEELLEDRTTSLEGLFAFLDVDLEPASTIKERWKNRYRVNVDGKKKMKPVLYPPMEIETRERLSEHFRPYNERLAAWLGRDLPEWS